MSCIANVTSPSGGYRSYDRGLLVAGKDGSPNEVTAYAESRDGVIWSRPTNNGVLRAAAPVTPNFSVFLDSRADPPATERWKAIGGTLPSGLMRDVSADGVSWRKFADGAPMLPPVKAYRSDSQNLAFWSEAERRYVYYFHTFIDVPGRSTKVRWVARASSPDFQRWRGIFFAIATGHHVARASSPDFQTWTEEGDLNFHAADGAEAEASPRRPA